MDRSSRYILGCSHWFSMLHGATSGDHKPWHPVLNATGTEPFRKATPHSPSGCSIACLFCSIACLCHSFQSPALMPNGAMALWMHMALLQMPSLPSLVPMSEAPLSWGPCTCCLSQSANAVDAFSVLHVPAVDAFSDANPDVDAFSVLLFEASRSHGPSENRLAWSAWHAAACPPQEPRACIAGSHGPEASLSASEPKQPHTNRSVAVQVAKGVLKLGKETASSYIAWPSSGYTQWRRPRLCKIKNC